MSFCLRQGASAGAVLAWLERQAGSKSIGEIATALGVASDDALQAPLQALQDSMDIYVKKGRYSLL